MFRSEPKLGSWAQRSMSARNSAFLPVFMQRPARSSRTMARPSGSGGAAACEGAIARRAHDLLRFRVLAQLAEGEPEQPLDPAELGGSRLRIRAPELERSPRLGHGFGVVAQGVEGLEHHQAHLLLRHGRIPEALVDL